MDARPTNAGRTAGVGTARRDRRGTQHTDAEGQVKRRQQDRMLDRAMSKVAALAIQMGIPEEEALRLFANQYRKFDSPTSKDQP